MAIQFARAEYVSRSKGGDACRKAAYNSGGEITNERTGEVFNFKDKRDGTFHEILLPEYVDPKFKKASVFANSVEAAENRKNSQLFREYVIALPDDPEVTPETRMEALYAFIEEKGFVKEGLGVQIDVHEPHEGEKNRHAHLLVTTRRFSKCGTRLGEKARDLCMEVRGGTGYYAKYDAGEDNGKLWASVQNRIFEKYGLEVRVDPTGTLTQEHVGPRRFRSPLNKKAERNSAVLEINAALLRSGDDLLDKVSANSSLFSRKDLERAVRHAGTGEAEKLVEEALASKELLPLVNEEGLETGLYTTKEARGEEKKILRLASYVNSKKKPELFSGEILEEAAEGLNQGQKAALEYVRSGGGGLKIIKGRAGTGKSRLFASLASAAEKAGLAAKAVTPTHKSKAELLKAGFASADTVKGFLFKLKNGTAEISRGSLLLVDEAGMVGNEDYSELLRTAAVLKLTVILSGDDRQLASVSRGGIFPFLAEKFGSSGLDKIVRQKPGAAREIAEAFSKGRVGEAYRILESQGRLINSANREESTERLAEDWAKSRFPVENRLIIALKNADVDALNLATRAKLKSLGLLSGPEYRVTRTGSAGISFAKGDRIVFTETDKESGASNGDFGTVTELGPKEFLVIADSGKEIKFDPREFSGFKHGYAATIYKTQGASVGDVYSFRGGFSTIQNAYVAGSRHIEDLRLYTDSESTKDRAELIRQTYVNLERGTSLAYFTPGDLEKLEKEKEKSPGFASSLWAAAKEGVRGFVDRTFPDAEYYSFERPEKIRAEVEAVPEEIYERPAEEEKTPETQKPGRAERFYAKFEAAKRAEGSENRRRERTEEALKKFYGAESDRLRSAVKRDAENVARYLLGPPNPRLSRGGTLRYGSKGSLSVETSGNAAGTWYDFESGRGGDMFDLVEEKTGRSFKEAAEFLRARVGSGSQSLRKAALDEEIRNIYTDHAKESKKREALKTAELAEITEAEKLYSKSKPITQNAVAYRYLRETRSVTADIGEDLRTTGIFDPAKGKYFPALIAFARDAEGRITGGQKISLDPETARKADVEVPKRSFGRISGSFVEISKGNERAEYGKPGVTIIAEGVETALAIASAGTGARIVCSLGVGNIRNYAPEAGEKIIIAGDNDGEGAASEKSAKEAEALLSEKAPTVWVKPREEGDFADVLKSGGPIKGAEEIRRILEPALESLEKTAEKDRAFLEISKPQPKAAKAKIQDPTERYTEYVRENLASIIEEGYAEIGGRRFECPAEYLKHEIENPRAHADVVLFKRSMPRLREMEAQLQKQREYSKDGP